MTADSFEIMRELHRRYPQGEAQTPAMGADQTALEHLFLTYALGRTQGLKHIRFVVEWARMASGHGAGLASVVRVFMCLYFLTLITAGLRQRGEVGPDPDDVQAL